MFSGQLFDALATPVVGVLCDRSLGLPSLGWCRRKLWVVGGGVVVLGSFCFVFAFCVPCWFLEEPSQTVLLVFYAFFASVFNIGWAASQVAHMALVPELSPDPEVRVVLNSARYAFTVLANVAVMGIFWILLTTTDETKVVMNADGVQVLTQGDFRVLTFSTLALGAVCLAVFAVGVKAQAPACAPQNTQGPAEHTPQKAQKPEKDSPPEESPVRRVVSADATAVTRSPEKRRNLVENRWSVDNHTLYLPAGEVQSMRQMQIARMATQVPLAAL
jgi:Na+/melibiose symporter-like transporter